MPQINQQKKGNFRNIDKFLSTVYLSPKNHKTYPPIKKDDVDEILVLGVFVSSDAILYVPAIKVIKKNFPNARISMVCTKAIQAVIKEQKLIDDFFIIKRLWGPKSTGFLNKISNSFSAIKSINQVQYDLAIDFTGDWRAIFLMNFIKSARKVSYNTEGGSYMLTDPVIPNAEIDHITDEAFYLLKKIGCEFTHNEKVPVLEFTEENHDFINEFKAAHKLDDKLVIGVYPVAGSDENKWDEEKYAELITRLAINYSNCIFIIFSEHNDKAITAKIGKTLKDNNIIDYLVVNKPLHELTLLANLSRLIICNDSNAAKMTAAYKQPALIIFGNEPAETADEDAPAIKKFISHNLEAKGYKPNAENISVEQVYNPAIELINNIINQ